MRFNTSITSRLDGRHRAVLQMTSFKDKRILDVGASFGWFEFLVRDAREIIGIDPSSKDLEVARQECQNPNAAFMEGSALDLSRFKEAPFDMVVMLDVIEHIPQGTEEVAIKEVRSVLKKGGCFLLTTPCRNLSVLTDPAWYFGHRHYSKSTLFRLLENNGFKVQRIYQGGGVFEVIAMCLFYPCKWFFNCEIPFKSFFDRKRIEEHSSTSGFVTWFVIASTE